MKTSKLLALLLCFVCFVSVSCSSDKDTDSEEIAKGEKMVAWIESQILDNEGNIIFFPSTNDDDVYVFGVENCSIALSLCQKLLQTEFQGENYTCDLPGNKGEIKVSSSSKDGYYYIVDFKVSGIPAFQLYLMHPQAIEDDNTMARIGGYECTNCHCSYNNCPRSCSNCGSTNFRKRGGML